MDGDTPNCGGHSAIETMFSKDTVLPRNNISMLHSVKSLIIVAVYGSVLSLRNVKRDIYVSLFYAIYVIQVPYSTKMAHN